MRRPLCITLVFFNVIEPHNYVAALVLVAPVVALRFLINLGSSDGFVREQFDGLRPVKAQFANTVDHLALTTEML